MRPAPRPPRDPPPQRFFAPDASPTSPAQLVRPCMCSLRPLLSTVHLLNPSLGARRREAIRSLPTAPCGKDVDVEGQRRTRGAHQRNGVRTPPIVWAFGRTAPCETRAGVWY